MSIIALCSRCFICYPVNRGNKKRKKNLHHKKKVRKKQGESGIQKKKRALLKLQGCCVCNCRWMSCFRAPVNRPILINSPELTLSTIPPLTLWLGLKGLGWGPVGHKGLKCPTFCWVHISFFIYKPHLSISLHNMVAVYSIGVKTVTRAEGHGGTPHPIELTSPGWFSFQLSSTQTGVSNCWTECKLISAQHTVRRRAGMTTIHN